MSRRISDWIRAGELDNTINNSVQGWLHLWGQRHPLLLQLTGNGGRGLRGRRVRFRAANARARSGRCPRALQAQQIGPTGKMRLAPHEIAGDNTWRMRLLLEWFSQDGHMVMELWEPTIEFILRPDRRGGAEQLGNLLAVDPEEVNLCETPCGAAAELSDEGLNDRRSPGSGLATERYDHLLRDIVAGTRDVPLNTLFDPPLRLLPAAQMTDRELSRTLRKVLARLARHGIAIDVCRHFNARQTYCWLFERILPGEEVFPDLPRLGYVMHYLTSDSCEDCGLIRE